MDDLQRPVLLLPDVRTPPPITSYESPIFFSFSNTESSGAPANKPTVFSRLASAEYWQRQCELFFPKEGEYTYSSGLGKTAADVNARTKGWHLPEFLDAESRLLFVNGEFDPWRPASVASPFRPGGPLVSTPDVPSILIPGSRHCNDLGVRNAVNPGVAKAQKDIVAQMAKWTGEFYGAAKGRRSFRSSAARRLRAPAFG